MKTNGEGNVRGKSGFTVSVHAAEEGGYWAEEIELPGRMSQGESEEVLLASVAGAITAVLDSYAEDGEDPPLPDPILRTVRLSV